MLILPSYFSKDNDSHFYDQVYNNINIKIGQVINANYPDDSKKEIAFITYDVMVNDQKDSTQFNAIYYDCMPIQMFGSATDYFEYSLRANVSDNQTEDLLTAGADIPNTYNDDNSGQVDKLLGATVILACIGGDSSNAVIIGALPAIFLGKNKNYKPQSKDNGKFLKFNFNGIYVNINNEGELFVQRQGPTAPDGSFDGKEPSDRNVIEEKANSFIKINKDGEIILSTTTKKDAQDIIDNENR